MKSLYVIGDSHAGRMANTVFDVVQAPLGINKRYSTCSSSYHYRVFDHIDGGGNEVFHGMMSNLFSIENNDIKVSVASTPGRSALNFDYDFYDYMKNWDSEESLIMPWLGYIDIKNWLPQKNLKNYKNVNEVVDIYVEKTLKWFKKSKIIFLTPMPQFEVVITARWANMSSDPAIEFEDRYSTHLEFVEALKNKCISVGIQEPISVSKIIDTEWITPDMQFKHSLQELYNDHLRPEFYAKILKNIINAN